MRLSAWPVWQQQSLLLGISQSYRRQRALNKSRTAFVRSTGSREQQTRGSVTLCCVEDLESDAFHVAERHFPSCWLAQVSPHMPKLASLFTSNCLWSQPRRSWSVEYSKSRRFESISHLPLVPLTIHFSCQHMSWSPDLNLCYRCLSPGCRKSELAGGGVRREVYW